MTWELSLKVKFLQCRSISNDKYTHLSRLGRDPLRMSFQPTHFFWPRTAYECIRGSKAVGSHKGFNCINPSIPSTPPVFSRQVSGAASQSLAA